MTKPSKKSSDKNKPISNPQDCNNCSSSVASNESNKGKKNKGK